MFLATNPDLEISPVHRIPVYSKGPANSDEMTTKRHTRFVRASLSFPIVLRFYKRRHYSPGIPCHFPLPTYILYFCSCRPRPIQSQATSHFPRSITYLTTYLDLSLGECVQVISWVSPQHLRSMLKAPQPYTQDPIL